MRKTTAYFLMVLLAFLCLGLTNIPKAASQTQSIKILQDSFYVDSSGYLDVIGQIQNTGSNTVDSVYLTGSIFTKSVDQADSATDAYVADLVPNEVAPFYMEFGSPNSSPDGAWDELVSTLSVSIAVSMANSTNNYLYPGLSVVSSSGSVGTEGNFSGAYVVNGVIKNTGNQSANGLWVVGTFFNSTGSICGVGYSDYLTPTNLEPNATTTFRVAAFDLNQTIVGPSWKITSYQLLVQEKGPVLQGNAPTVAPYQGAGGTGTSPHANSQGSTTPSAKNVVPPKNSPITTIYLVLAAVSILVVASVVAVMLLKRDKSHQTVKEARKAQKQKPVKSAAA